MYTIAHASLYNSTVKVAKIKIIIIIIKYITCKSSNLVYCITCKIFKKQYVGQTQNSITQRFSSHFVNMRHKKQTDAVGLPFATDRQWIS